MLGPALGRQGCYIWRFLYMLAWPHAPGPLVLFVCSFDVRCLRISVFSDAAVCTLSSESHLVPSVDDVIDEVLTDDAHLLLSRCLVLVSPVLILLGHIEIPIIRWQSNICLNHTPIRERKTSRIRLAKRLLDFDLDLKLISIALALK